MAFQEENILEKKTGRIYFFRVTFWLNVMNTECTGSIISCETVLLQEKNHRISDGSRPVFVEFIHSVDFSILQTVIFPHDYIILIFIFTP